MSAFDDDMYKKLMNVAQEVQNAPKEYKINVELKSETILGAGIGVPGGVDLDIVRDKDGKPYIKAATIKGLIREQLDIIAKFSDGLDKDVVDSLFGVPNAPSQGKIKFWDLETNPIYSKKDDTDELVRYSTAIDSEKGSAKEGSLRSFTAIREGVKFTGKVTFNEELTDQEVKSFSSAIKAVRHIGTNRTRGKGEVVSRLLENDSEVGGLF
jgi:CRISPR-associated protein Csx10